MSSVELGSLHSCRGCPCCARGDRLCVNVGAGGPALRKANGAPQPASCPPPHPPPPLGSPEGLPLAVSQVSWEWTLLQRDALYNEEEVNLLLLL